MTTQDYHDFRRYLSAKKHIDDRSLNRHVYGRLARQLAKASSSRPLQVLEIGAGIGTMPARLLEWGLQGRIHYTALDANPGFVTQTHEWLSEWAKLWDFNLVCKADDELLLERANRDLTLSLVNSDIFDFLAHSQSQTWDLVIAHAFLDLVDLETLLPQLLSILESEGLFYFTLNFDGATILEPAVEPELDTLIEKLYHQTMDTRIVDGKPSGDSKTGRRLLSILPQLGATIQAAGSSDWVILPGENGYRNDDAFFLHFIVETIRDGLKGHPELDQQAFSAWVEERHNQVDRKQLIYIAHQIDIVGKR